MPTLAQVMPNRIRQAVNLTGRARLVRNQTGFDAEHKCRYGLGLGGADLVGLLPSGRAIAIEVKTGAGRPTKEQTAWCAAFRRWGGFACIVHDEDEALAALARAEAGASE